MSGNLIKSGTHQLMLTAETYDRILCGTLTTELLQQPVVAAETPIAQVVIQASNDNAVGSIVYVGGSVGATIELTPGDTLTLLINDLNKVCVRGSAAGLVVNYLALR